MEQRAEFAAMYLQNDLWKNNVEFVEDNRPPILGEVPKLELGEIRTDEVIFAIKKLNKRKAAGPDSIPIELFKSLNKDGIEEVKELVLKK